MTEGGNEDAAARETPPAAVRARGEGLHLGRASLTVLAALVLALLLVGSAPYWAPPLLQHLPWGAAHDTSQEVAALDARVDQTEAAHKTTEKRLGEIEQRQAQVAAAATASPAVTALTQRVAALETHPPDTAEIAAALAPVKQELGQLTERLAAIETQLDKLATHSNAANGAADRMLLLAIVELRADIASSRSYAGELATVKAMAQDRPELAGDLKALAAQADAGIPSTALLAARFASDTAPAILRSAAPPPAESGWGERILARIESLVVIHRIGGGPAATHDPIAAATTRAQTALDGGDLAGAVKALATLDGPAQTAAQSWLAAARQRLAAEATLDDMTARIAAHLAPTASPAAGAAEGAEPH